MPQRSDHLLFQVIANEIDITAYVNECSISFDLSRRVSEASLRLREWPAGVQYWDTLDIYAGCWPDDDSGPDDGFTHGMLHRFTGFVWDPGHNLWPMSSDMLGRGPLILAERQTVPSDEELDALAHPEWPVQYLAPGVDLSADPDTQLPWHDYDMVAYVLGFCGLTDRIDNIGGNPHLLGTAAYDQFCWTRRESGLSCIEKLDLPSMGFRTYDAMPCCVSDPTRTIRRTRVDMLPDVVTTKATFLEGRDLFAGSNMKRAPSLIKNCVRVEGWNDGGGPMLWVSMGAHPVPPSGIPNFLDTEYFSSPLIERDTVDWATGFSAKEMADWTLEQRIHDWREVTAETWRDDPITAGESLYVNSPRLGGSALAECNQNFWVQAVEIKIAPGTWRQTFRLRAPAYWTGPGSVLGALQLGGSLGG